MNAQDYLNEAQNTLDSNKPTELLANMRALAQAQMATALAIMEQTEAIKANQALGYALARQ